MVLEPGFVACKTLAGVMTWRCLTPRYRLSAVWIHFKLQGSLASIATYVVQLRQLEDCKSHVLTLRLQGSGLASVHVDGFERARCATLPVCCLDSFEFCMLALVIVHV